MKHKEEEYREIFLAEALENFETINRLLTQLEKNSQDKNAINALFRITHTLKGNAAGMGYSNIADLAHVLEDLFGEMRDGKILVTEEIFSTIFKGIDVLGHLIDAVKESKEVKFKGIKTKLEVLTKKARENEKENAVKKLREKNADLIVLNSLNDEGAGFKYDTNKVTIFRRDGQEKKFETKSKELVAKDIVDSIIELF